MLYNRHTFQCGNQDNTLRSYLARLAINLEAFAFSTAPPPDPETKPPPPKELIFSETIPISNEPTIIRHEESSNPHIYVVWRVQVFICVYPLSIQTIPTRLTYISSTKSKISQACYIFSTYRVFEASWKGQKHPRRRISSQQSPHGPQPTSILRT